MANSTMPNPSTGVLAEKLMFVLTLRMRPF